MTSFVATASDIVQCQFVCWHGIFQKYTMKNRVIKLNEEFIKYLGEDNLILPSSASRFLSDDQLSDDEDVHDAQDDEEDNSTFEHDFTALENEIVTAITALKGEVFPKLNWSAPNDASWMTGGSMKCRNVAELYLLLKASDRVTFDIEKMFSLCTDTENIPQIEYTLVLKKWANLNPAMEFRVFVANRRLVGKITSALYLMNDGYLVLHYSYFSTGLHDLLQVSGPRKRVHLRPNRGLL